MSRRTRLGIENAILPAIAAAAVVSMSPSPWMDAKSRTGAQANPLHDHVGPVVAHGRMWLDGGPHRFRDRLAAAGDEYSVTATPDGEASAIRIVRGGATLTGPARAIDGDTLVLGRARIRLHGIDAPESAQRCRARGRLWACGREATRALARLIGRKQIACEERDRDRYGRIVAVCTAAGQDLNAWMVAEGWALAYRRYSRAYVAAERRARAAKRGVWRGQIVAPWDWRRGKRLASAQAVRPKGTGRCNIKGNIGRSGKARDGKAFVHPNFHMVVAGQGVAAMSIADLAESVLLSAVLITPQETVTRLRRWIDGEPIRFANIAVLTDFRLEHDMTVAEGVDIRRLPDHPGALFSVGAPPALSTRWRVLDAGPNPLCGVPASWKDCVAPAFFHPSVPDEERRRFDYANADVALAG